MHLLPFISWNACSKCTFDAMKWDYQLFTIKCTEKWNLALKLSTFYLVKDKWASWGRPTIWRKSRLTCYNNIIHVWIYRESILALQCPFSIFNSPRHNIPSPPPRKKTQRSSNFFSQRFVFQFRSEIFISQKDTEFFSCRISITDCKGG